MPETLDDLTSQLEEVEASLGELAAQRDTLLAQAAALAATEAGLVADSTVVLVYLDAAWTPAIFVSVAADVESWEQPSILAKPWVDGWWDESVLVAANAWALVPNVTSPANVPA
jgi:hypothetical protein